jgi:GIY-YIG catalytic domain
LRFAVQFKPRNFQAMPAGQLFLFAPERPLVQRLGQNFFRQLPQRAGVYQMRDARGKIVYVGKAKNLRQRLNSYRVANPERLGRRQLRLLQEVRHIELAPCRNEAAALQYEAKLIRALKPKFNRAGVWPSRPAFLIWRWQERTVEFAVRETPPPGWERWGLSGGYAPRLRALLVRLLWLALNPARGFHQLPPGWARAQMPENVQIECYGRVAEMRHHLENAFWGEREVFLSWLAKQLAGNRPAFDQLAVAKDILELEEFFAQRDSTKKQTKQLALL